MVLTLAIPLRKFYHLEALVTDRHIDNCGKIMLVTGFIVAYGYGMEAFMAGTRRRTGNCSPSGTAPSVPWDGPIGR